jgi:hypothetical protein
MYDFIGRFSISELTREPKAMELGQISRFLNSLRNPENHENLETSDLSFS